MKVTKIKGRRFVCLLATMVITAIALESEDTLAGGLWLNEYGDFSGGRAAAGAAAGLDDAAAIFYNPAGIGRIKVLSGVAARADSVDWTCRPVEVSI